MTLATLNNFINRTISAGLDDIHQSATYAQAAHNKRDSRRLRREVREIVRSVEALRAVAPGLFEEGKR